MAKFTEVMRQAKRICTVHGGICSYRCCPLADGEKCRLNVNLYGEDYNELERIIMDWAAEHTPNRCIRRGRKAGSNCSRRLTLDIHFARKSLGINTGAIGAKMTTITSVTAMSAWSAPCPPRSRRSWGLSRLITNQMMCITVVLDANTRKGL